MKKISTYVLTSLLALFTINVSAQDISIANKNIKITEGTLNISFDIGVEGKSIKSNEGVILTPILQSGDKAIPLPQIIINGRNRNISYKRERRKYNVVSPYAVIKRKRNEVSIIEYRVAIPFEKWMNGSDLILDRDDCGCRSNIEHITAYMVAQNISLPKPTLVVIVPTEPAPSAPKSPKIEKHTLVETFYFKDNVTLISPNYDVNKNDLTKILSLINDKKTTITAIEIIGSASPLGVSEHNEQLSKQRAITLESYIKENSNVDPKNIETTWVGENWNLLSTLVSLTNMDYKEQILNIISSNSTSSERKIKLMKLGEGKPYNYIRTNLYPKLRQVSCIIHYYITED